jgi:hypothetical protein
MYTYVVDLLVSIIINNNNKSIRTLFVQTKYILSHKSYITKNEALYISERI